MPAAAIGKRIEQVAGDPREVIGVVEDVRDDRVDAAAPAIVYWPMRLKDDTGADFVRAATFVVRSPAAGTDAFVKQVQQAVWSVNGNLPVAAVQTMADVYGRSLSRTTFTLIMLAIAGGMALALGVIGIYGVLAYAIAQRRREIGIRLALGERHTSVHRRFLRHGLVLTCLGLCIGLAASAVVTRLMASLLFEVSTVDPLTYLAVALLLAAAAGVASYLPARRASRVPLVEVLAGQ